MAGVDRETGRLLDGWDHVVQSIMLIITTGYGERMLRRWFGSAIPHLLGETLTTPTVVRFFAALIAALEVREIDAGNPSWFVAGSSFLANADRLVIGDVVGGTGLPREPRFKITKITPKRVDRTGELRLEIVGIYMPRGHLGDFTPVDMRTITLRQGDGGSIVPA